MLIPKHLREISDVINITKNFELTKIKCKCGCCSFIVYRSVLPLKLNIKHVGNEIIRENDKLYLIKRNFFGKIIQKDEFTDTFNKKPRNVVKVKCERCDSEYILFDNYKHGYDAISTSFSDSILCDISTKFEEVYPQLLEVFVKIYQDISYDLFQEEFESSDYETYLNSFGNIEIYGITSSSKKVKICLEETA